MFVAAAAMMFASCDKENNNENGSGSGGGSELNIADNTVVYDGVTYHMITRQNYRNEDMTQFWAYSEELDGNDNLMVYDELHIHSNMWNKKADIFAETNDDINWQSKFKGSVLEADIYEDFSACTIGIYGNNDGSPVTLTFEGTLKNGKTIKMKLVSGNAD